MSTQDPIAFFGATGGCANAVLARSLKAGYRCSALARTPQKLNDMLTANGVSKETIDKNLRVVQGDARDLETIRKVLFYDNEPVVKIVSGMGSPPTLNPKKMDGTICQDNMRNVLKALKEANFEKKPYLASISTTGISEGGQDVPLLFRPMYHWLLALPHADKKVVETMVTEAAEQGNTISGYTLVRPSFLMDDKPKGMERIKVGSEQQPAVGYTINRSDVGLWIFEELVKGDAFKWNGQKPSITN